MSGQPLDAETSEMVAGVVRLLRRAAELVWGAIDTDAYRPPRRATSQPRVRRWRALTRGPSHPAGWQHPAGGGDRRCARGITRCGRLRTSPRL